MTPADEVPAGEVPSPRAPRKHRRIVRWEGLIPIVLLLALAALGWLLFGERLLRESLEEAATKALGTEVNVATLRLHPLTTTLELGGIQVADPFDVHRNLVEAGGVRVVLDPEPLAQKKIVIDGLVLRGVRTGTTRKVAAHPVTGGGFAPRAMVAMRQWARQFDVPLLSLTPVDTIRAIILDPKQLKTVQAALALARQADSTRDALEAQYRALRLQETLDSAQALVQRLRGTNPRTLGITGVQGVIADVRRTAARVDSAKRRVQSLQRSTIGAVDSLRSGVLAVDTARRADYAFARGLLKLPSFEAPEIGPALFGPVSIDRFQRALYWTTLAREYVPPGLLPKEEPGPRRRRMSGTTVVFVSPRSFPQFLLRRADLELSIGDGPARGDYVLAVQNVTTEPALVGKPTVFALRRRASGSDVESIRASGSLDHTRARQRDVVNAQATGVKLPSLTIPMLPLRAEPGRGTSELRLVLDGDQVAARWAIRSGAVAWVSDSARARRLNTLESLVARVITGVTTFDLTAELNGPVRKPVLTVRSSLDRAIAEQVKKVAGEEIAKAERRVRAQVDSVADEKVTPVRERVVALRDTATQRIADARAKLDAQREQLDAQLRSVSGGLASLPKLPKTPELPPIPEIPKASRP